MNSDDHKMEEDNEVDMESEDSSSEEEVDDDRVDDEDDDEEAMDNGEDGEEKTISRVYIPNVTKVNKSQEEGADNEEELDVDLSAYVMYHRAETGFPCLSFDIIEDGLGSGTGRADTFPMTSYLVAGTQANKAHLNNLLVLKMDNITATKKDDDDEDEGVDDDDEDLPNLHAIQMSHNGCVNRVRSKRIGDRYVAATWSELGSVHVWDLNPALEAVDDPVKANKFKQSQAQHKPIYSFTGHPMEGFAMDWAPGDSGALATGDCQKNIFLWKLLESGWTVDMLPLTGHTDSVEDLQWSPNQENILASCSVDKTVRIWDVRTKSKPAITVDNAHEADVNVINWNKNEKAFILSASDDGLIKVWDMRMFGRGPGGPRPVATFKHHHAPITSVEWHPTDGTVFAASSEDDQITIWDLAVESDSAAATDSVATEDDQDVNALPPQLLFIHQGQKEMKELHWHPQIPGVLISTALTGFDVFRTISV